MKTNTLGKTGLKVSCLGVGQAERMDLQVTKSNIDEVGAVLGTALDRGINFIDTAACYGNSEELIGHAIGHRRSDYILATKCGHVSGTFNSQEGLAWTADTITHSIERSLIRLKTDYLDLVQLHSCDVSILENMEVIEALLNAKRLGKTRFVGYSGDNEAALWAVNSGMFDTLQTSFNIVDQYARIKLFGPAKAKNMGIIIKRPIANMAWGATNVPSKYASEYFDRAQVMSAIGSIPEASSDHLLTAMGFVFDHSDVDTVIVGTQNQAHMKTNIALVEDELPISTEIVDELRLRFDAKGANWRQLT